MPTYAYQCEKCKAEFEAFASIQKKEAGWQKVDQLQQKLEKV